MTKTITIRDVDDLYERYKMPDLEFRKKHQGKYHSTYITNLPKICKAIHMDHHVVSKFFGWKLSTQAKYDDSTDELQMKGSFEYDQLLVTLREFINEYILCPKCTYPELDFIAKKKKLGSKCRACGERSMCDMNDRVYKILLPEVLSNPEKYKKLVKKTPKVAVAEDEGLPVGDDFDESALANIQVEEEEVEWGCDISEEAMLKRRQEMEGQSVIMKSIFR